jgi:hypothetical protein
MTGCGFARQLVQVRNDDRLDPQGRPAVQVQLLLVLPGFLQVLELGKNRVRLVQNPASRPQGIPHFVEEHYFIAALQGAPQLTQFMLDLSLDGF